ncbi:FAD-dependent monooxygenase [Streptomyces sp. NBC_00390]|uniref:FAD-dependent monooxygenase n=1 Tax=Streptomyces sp. NBC_00390 TaxID=2975736 RepID=UPI002E23DBEA
MNDPTSTPVPAADAHQGLHSEQGALRGEHPGRAAQPVIKVIDLAWLEFTKPDLDRAETFAHDFGFITAARTDDTLYLRGAMAGPHCLVIRRGPASRFIGPAFQAADTADLDRLARATGHKVRTLTALPRAVHLDDEVHRIRQAMGVHETFGAISRPARGMRLVDGSHRVLAEFRRDNPCGRYGFPEANMFDQPELEQLMRDNLQNHPLVTLRGGIEVTAVTPPPHGGAPVPVTFRDEDTGVSRTILADAVLGCDGANSLVRASIGSRMQDLAASQQWLVVDVRCRLPLPAWDGVHQLCDPQRAATYMRVGEDRYRWEFRLRTGEQPEELTDRGRDRAGTQHRGACRGTRHGDADHGSLVPLAPARPAVTHRGLRPAAGSHCPALCSRRRFCSATSRLTLVRTCSPTRTGSVAPEEGSIAGWLRLTLTWGS